MIPTQEDAPTKLSPDDARQQFIDNRDDKSYRHAYADESLNLSIATQIKVLREQRKLRQIDLASEAGMKQSMISRYENVNYSSWSITTLKKLAEALDVVLDVRFRSFRDLVIATNTFSRESLQVPTFADDPFFVTGAEEIISQSASQDVIVYKEEVDNRVLPHVPTPSSNIEVLLPRQATAYVNQISLQA